jgi:thiamine biosynthesis lipoprotein
MSRPAALPRRRVEHCMGTVFSFDVRLPGVDAAALDAAVAWLHHVDVTFSTFRPDSVISRLAEGTIRAAQLTDEVRDVLARCAELTEQTDGYFSAYFDGALDPSGYVKGWAIERASELLEAAGSRNHCVNGGGDVQCVGESVPGRPWRVGIADPLDPRQLYHSITGSGRLAVATSGTAERGAHITDPHTRRPPVGLASVTVAGESLATVDAYATAAFAMGLDAREWLSGLPGVAALIVQTDGAAWRTGDPHATTELSAAVR